MTIISVKMSEVNQQRLMELAEQLGVTPNLLINDAIKAVFEKNGVQWAETGAGRPPVIHLNAYAAELFGGNVATSIEIMKLSPHIQRIERRAHRWWAYFEGKEPSRNDLLHWADPVTIYGTVMGYWLPISD